MSNSKSIGAIRRFTISTATLFAVACGGELIDGEFVDGDDELVTLSDQELRSRSGARTSRGTRIATRVHRRFSDGYWYWAVYHQPDLRLRITSKRTSCSTIRTPHSNQTNLKIRADLAGVNTLSGSKCCRVSVGNEASFYICDDGTPRRTRDYFAH